MRGYRTAVLEKIEKGREALRCVQPKERYVFKLKPPEVNRYQPHRGGQNYIFRFASNRLSHEESLKAAGHWTSYCFCQRPTIPVKVETAHKGIGYGLFEWQSICYACGLPPEICTCPTLDKKEKLGLHEMPKPNGHSFKLWKAMCERRVHRSQYKVVTQTTFNRFDEGFPLDETSWEISTSPHYTTTTSPGFQK